MRIPFGIDAAGLQKNERYPIVWNSDRLINGHTLLLGMPGTGKTHTIRKMLGAMQAQSSRVRVHVFDVHGDIDIPGASEVLYSEQTPYGLNPLRVNADMHYGGVRRSIENFISTINKTSTKLGPRQEAVLRNVLFDVYRLHGFDADRPETWVIDESAAHLVSDGNDNRLYLDVPFDEKEAAKAFGAKFDGHKRLWWVYSDQYEGGITRWRPKTAGRTHPTLSDVVNYANRLLKMSFMGADHDAVTQLEIFAKAASAFHRKQLDTYRNGGNPNPMPKEEAAELREQAKQDAKDFVSVSDTIDKDLIEKGIIKEKESPLEKARQKAAESYVRYLNSARTGEELEDLIKYDSTDTLKSVVDRLESLRATGIFKTDPPPFDPKARIWVHKLNPLPPSVSKMFVVFRLRELYEETMQRGQQKELLDVLVLDEVHRYTDDDDGILSTICRESRKFGVAVIAATQTPDLPTDFLGSVATKIILGIDALFWKSAEAKMNFERRLANWVKPQSTMAVQMTLVGSTRNDWKWVVLDNHLDTYVSRLASDAAAAGEAGRTQVRKPSQPQQQTWQN